MSEQPSTSNRSLWITIITLVGVLAAAGVAVAFHLAGAEITATMTRAGMAFVAAVTLGLAIRTFLAESGR